MVSMVDYVETSGQLYHATPLHDQWATDDFFFYHMSILKIWNARYTYLLIGMVKWIFHFGRKKKFMFKFY